MRDGASYAACAAVEIGIYIMSHKLSNYRNLVDWALNAHQLEDLPTLPMRKDHLLRQLNEKLSTKYERKHIDNWLAERANTPKRVRELLIDELIETEVQFDDEELGKNLRRLLAS